MWIKCSEKLVQQHVGESVGRKNVESIADEDTDGTDDESGAQRRRNRTCFLPHQLEVLEKAFQDCRYPEAAARESLALQTRLSDSKIQVRRPGTALSTSDHCSF